MKTAKIIILMIIFLLSILIFVTEYIFLRLLRAFSFCAVAFLEIAMYRSEKKKQDMTGEDLCEPNEK